MIKSAPLVTLDFETYYDKDYSLSKLTTEAYVRDPRFEIMLCSFKVNNGPVYVKVGYDEVLTELVRLQLGECNVCCHHAHFDGFILAEKFGIKPGFWLDTLSMARALRGAKGKNSLKDLAKHYGVGAKGTAVHDMKGKHLEDLSPAALEAYCVYCRDDTQLTFDLLRELMFDLKVQYPAFELSVIDMTVRMFTEPVLRLDAPILLAYEAEIRERNQRLLDEAGVTITQIRSDPKFAQLLLDAGVDEIPLKPSPARKNEDGAPVMTYAFAKTDEAMEELGECGIPMVEALIAARIANKSSIAISRATRMAGMAQRGAAPVYLKYYGAATGRMSGGDKMNWQNFTRGSPLRKAVHAPEGHMLVVGDSSNIEARVLDCLAGQLDMRQIYIDNDAGTGADVYCVLASDIYGREIVECDEMKKERQMGKVAKLGLGYGMGGKKFCTAVRTMTKGGIVIDEDEGTRVVNIYRAKHPMVRALWRRGEEALKAIALGTTGFPVDPTGVVKTCDGGLLLPNGMIIRYPGLKKHPDGWKFWNGREVEYTYGAKVIENIVQALARIIVIGQTLLINSKYRVLLSVHDEAVSAVRLNEVEDAKKWFCTCLTTKPAWAATYPLNAKVDAAFSYGDAK